MAEWASDTTERAEEEVRHAADGLGALRSTLQLVVAEIAAASTRYASLPPGEEWDDEAGSAFAERARQLLRQLDIARQQCDEAVQRAGAALDDVLGQLVAA